MRNNFSWLPNINSWIKAILLATIFTLGSSLIVKIGQLLLAFGNVINFILSLLLALTNLLPDFIRTFLLWILIIIQQILLQVFSFLAGILSPFLFIVPVIVIAFSFHFLSLFVQTYFPDFQLLKTEKVTGYFPNLISWWQGFYGLLVIIVSLLFSDIFISFLPIFPYHSYVSDIQQASTSRLFFWFYLAIILFNPPLYTPLPRLFVWVIVAAFLYQFEAKVQEYLTSVNTQTANEDSRDG